MPPPNPDPLAGLDPAKLATDYVNGARPPKEQLLALPKALARNPTFGLGLRVFQELAGDGRLALTTAELAKLAQSAALCAYKDPDVPARDGLDRAIRILERYCDLEATDDPETLGLAGAVYKRKWLRRGRTADLRSSLDFYRRSFMGADWEEQPPPGDLERQRRRIAEDQGFTAINAAFMADVFAGALAAAGESAGAERQRREADRVRALILEVLAGLPDELAALLREQPPAPEGPLRAKVRAAAERRYWIIATQIEAALGRGELERAESYLGEVDGLPLFSTAERRQRYSWMRESTATQLAKLVRLRYPDPAETRPRQILGTLLGGAAEAEAVNSLVLGKVGLALSGGGFRAAFYHIGVLASLAERDALRHVEVISTVSGGSILGAAYYLLLKRRLERDDELGRDDYLEIVERLEREFLAAVQTDLRSTLYSELPRGLDHLLRPGVTVGEALGRKLEQLFYRPALGPAGDAPATGGASEPAGRIHMDELGIQPGGETGFHPGHHNWKRRSKVPLLVVNATALNTGHVWQFTASYAGESPYAIDQEVDSNARLRRFYYAREGGPPIPQRRMPLGTAVAASACVPGLFPAVELGELYEGYGVRLVDGGVHDNQGIVSLLEQDCTQIIVSDACGQMATESTVLGVGVAPLMRSNTVLMERVRQEEYRRVEALRDSALLGGFLFVHLRRDLAGEPVDWKDCEDPRQRPVRRELLDYGVRREYQEELAAMRTDLDAFSEVEAWALMYSGYRMTEESFDRSLPDLARLAPAGDRAHPWRFLSVAPLMCEHPPTDRRHDRFRRLLAEGRKQFLRDDDRATLAEHLVSGRTRWLARLGLALPPLAILGVGLGLGWKPALWTALGVVAGGALALALALTLGWLALRRATRAAGLTGAGESVSTLAFAAVLLTARRVSRVHLARYKDGLLDRGTVASLGAGGVGPP